MRSLKHIIFIFTVIVGLTFGVAAQQSDDQKKPPKNPPVIKPGEKPRPPKGDDRPKRPGHE